MSINLQQKTFNTTGVCIEHMHYMVNIEDKLDKIIDLINKNNYFVINRPRQFGKTTTLSKLQERLNEKYTIIRISFEGIGDKAFSDEELFCKIIIKLFSKALKKTNKELSLNLRNKEVNIHTLFDLDEAITDFIDESDKEVILIIDEVDKSSNNQLFLSFLGMLRNKYLLMRENIENSFKSVILAGVNDIKNLKISIRDGEELKQNSPWNIAINFDIDMSFSIYEIETMIVEYGTINKLEMDTKEISNKIYYYTNGYPFLVSRMCQIIDEDILNMNKRIWTTDDIKESIKLILREKNTLFESLVKNMESNKDLYQIIKEITLNGVFITYNALNPVIELGIKYGILREFDNRIVINNRLYEQVIYNYMISKIETSNYIVNYNHKNNFIINKEELDFESIMLKYQQFMKEQYSSKDLGFIEREGRLLFLAFIKPIINGVGFDFKEVQISEEKRLDVVITYNKYKYIVELKIWYGEQYHENGLKQLANYLDIENLDNGYLLVYNFNKNKEYKHEVVYVGNKKIFVVYL